MSVAKLSPAKEFVSMSATPKADPSVKVTLYINERVVKELKKLAIDEGLPYSELAEIAFSAYLQKEGKLA